MLDISLLVSHEKWIDSLAAERVASILYELFMGLKAGDRTGGAINSPNWKQPFRP